MTDNAVISANPGFYQLRLAVAGKLNPQTVKERVRVYPVIGWVISADARTPVTPDDTIVDGEQTALMLPGGVIVGEGGLHFKGIDSWATHIAERWRSRQPPASPPQYALGPIATPTPPPAAAPVKSAWGG